VIGFVSFVSNFSQNLAVVFCVNFTLSYILLRLHVRFDLVVLDLVFICNGFVCIFCVFVLAFLFFLLA